jgi:two-component system LytT family response regulator
MPSVVFVTAYDEFAVRAFESCALDYLVKPVTQVRFDATMARVRERLRAEDAVALAARLTRLLGVDGQPSRRIPVSTPEGTRLLDHTEIDWIQADDYYAIVHAGGARYLLRESLSSLEERLDPARFARVHRSALVAVDRVRELRTGNGDSLVVLRDGTRIPVSRRRREALSARLRARPDRSPHGDDRSRTSG